MIRHTVNRMRVNQMELSDRLFGSCGNMGVNGIFDIECTHGPRALVVLA